MCYWAQNRQVTNIYGHTQASSHSPSSMAKMQHPSLLLNTFFTQVQMKILHCTCTVTYVLNGKVVRCGVANNFRDLLWLVFDCDNR